MKFNEKLQNLRKQKGITQQQLAEALFVSRTAISKWESGKGYPSIDSIKLLADFFSVTVDELLSCNQLLCIAEEDKNKTKNHFLDILFGLLDISVVLFLLLPLFAQRTENSVLSVPLLSLSVNTVYLKVTYFIIIGITALFGVLTLAFQNCTKAFWLKNKSVISLTLSSLSTLLFIISLQPYAAALSFVFLIIKVLILVKSK